MTLVEYWYVILEYYLTSSLRDAYFIVINEFKVMFELLKIVDLL